MPSVLVVDDHAAVRAGVRTILAAAADIDVVAEAGTGAEAISAAERTGAEVVILDLHLPDRDGIDVCREIVRRGLSRVLVLTTFEIPDNVSAALDAGASGFLAKTAEPHQMIDAVRAVGTGHAYLAPSVTAHVIDRARRRGDDAAAGSAPAVAPASMEPYDDLTEREREILRLVADGLTNKQIAQRLTISPATAKTHLSRILQKLGVATRTQAALLARDRAPRP